MTNTPDNTTTCPTWCNREHLGQAADPDDGGYHHDGPLRSVVPSRPLAAEGHEQLFVRTAQYVADDQQARPAHVELENEARTLATLTPDEARRLAAHLMAAASECDRG